MTITERAASVLVVLLLVLVAATSGAVSLEFAVLFGLGVLAGWGIAHPRGSLVPAVLVALVLVGLAVPEWVPGLLSVPLMLPLLATSTGFAAQKTITEVLDEKSKIRTGLDLVPRRIGGATEEHRPAAAAGFGQQRNQDGGDEDSDEHHVHPINLRNGQHRRLRTFSRVGFLESGQQAGRWLS